MYIQLKSFNGQFQQKTERHSDLLGNQ